MKQGELVPVSEMARRLGVTRERVRQMILEGKLEGVRLGRYWYVREREGGRLRRVYTFFTHAGGAGKTSLARDLGFELARRGFRVLLVDTDPQANLTSWLGVREVAPEETLLHLVDTGQLPTPRRLSEWGLDLIPASLDLARVEVRLMQRPSLPCSCARPCGRRRATTSSLLTPSLPGAPGGPRGLGGGRAPRPCGDQREGRGGPGGGDGGGPGVPGGPGAGGP